MIDTWRRLAIPALTLHLTEVDVTEQEIGFHKALVMVPVCPSLLEKWLDPNELIALIAKESCEQYLLTARGQLVLERGTVSPLTVVHHKRSEHELGGHRYVVATCNSDRSAFVTTYQCEATAREIELLRFYVAMGLSKQHPDQKALLARTHDYKLAQEVTRTAQLLLDIPRITIRAITRDLDVREMQTRAWSSRCSPLTTSTSRLLQQQGSAPAECTQGEGLIFSAAMAWLKALAMNDP